MAALLGDGRLRSVTDAVVALASRHVKSSLVPE
jgi:hypothetical protein